MISICILSSVQVLGYPNFIGYGYGSCLTCHYNPLGNGPLNDYGRALGAVTISDRVFRKKSDDKIGKSSGFLYQKHKFDWLRPSIDFRNLLLQQNRGTEAEVNDHFIMDFNANAVFRLGPKENRDKLIASISLGYAPRPRNDPEAEVDIYRSREHYIGYRFSESWGLYAGLMDKAYGIRLVDHIAYSRSQTKNTMNDQSHGIKLHFTRPSIELAGQIFFGNLGEDATVRQSGFSLTGEYGLNLKNRIGGSLLQSSSEFLETSAIAFHSRHGFGKGNSLLFEFGQVSSNQILRGLEISSQYYTLQGHILLKRGLFFITTVEQLLPNTEEESKTMKWGPGIQYFVTQGWELRVDLYNYRSFDQEAVIDDSWDLAGQIHLWF